MCIFLLSSRRIICIAGFLVIGAQYVAKGQGIYADSTLRGAVERIVRHIYNVEVEPALQGIDSLRARLPNHPLVDILAASQIFWSEAPVTESSASFEHFVDYLLSAIKKGNVIRKSGDVAEGAVFEMLACGMLAERYANEGRYFMSIKYAKIVYKLLPTCEEITQKNLDCYFLIGLYNYFRVRYPLEFPVYGPLLSLLRDGDMQRGLQQIHTAADLNIFSRPEANTYLAYIRLVYESEPAESCQHLIWLTKAYPRNLFYAYQLAQAYIEQHEYALAEKLVYGARQDTSSYYMFVSAYLKGFLEEKLYHRTRKAQAWYLEAVTYSKNVPKQGNYYQGCMYLGLGRLAEQRGDKQQARRYYAYVADVTGSVKLRTKALEANRAIR